MSIDSFVVDSSSVVNRSTGFVIRRCAVIPFNSCNIANISCTTANNTHSCVNINNRRSYTITQTLNSSPTIAHITDDAAPQHAARLLLLRRARHAGEGEGAQGEGA